MDPIFLGIRAYLGLRFHICAGTVSEVEKLDSIQRLGGELGDWGPTVYAEQKWKVSVYG